MALGLLSGSANLPLAEAVGAALGVTLARRDLFRYPDGELHVELTQSVRGADVYLLDPTSPPVEEHLFELLLLADACHRAGAARLTAVIPYLGYARQDRRARGREPVGARLVADLLSTARLDRVVGVDVHIGHIEGLFAIPFEHLTAVPLLAEALEAAMSPLAAQAIVVAPDLGATKLAERYAARLNAPVAIVHKTRLSGTEVAVRRITGDVRDRMPLIVDDMISTGSTIVAAVEALQAAGAVPEVIVAASHGLLVADAAQRLAAAPIRRLVVTDSVLLPRDFPLPLEVVTLAPLLAEAIKRLHADHSLSELLRHT